ncbi:RNA polymerase sigma-70 protein [Pseudomonas savastanoi pv. glycinea]|nr:RNA polymerase sigma-70 protein [Pseudomonas savastanoi pv. glycinea]
MAGNRGCFRLAGQSRTDDFMHGATRAGTPKLYLSRLRRRLFASGNRAEDWRAIGYGQSLDQAQPDGFAGVHGMNRPLDDNIHDLAGEYVLGTLSAQERFDVQRRLPHEPDLQAAIDAWEQRLLPLTELAEPVTPSPGLWDRIERNLLELAAPAKALHRQRVRWWDNLSVWRGLAGAGLAASLVLGMTLLTRAPAQPSYLVVLVGQQDKAPGWVVQASNSQEIQLIPLGVFEVPNDKALEFWTKGDDWQGPVSLGLVKPGQSLHVPLDKLPPLQPNQLFELTLEKSTGSPIGKPTGPIQFIGRAVKVI